MKTRSYFQDKRSWQPFGPPLCLKIDQEEGMEIKADKTFDIEIESLTFGGMGLGRINGQVVFVPHTAPGDLIKTVIIKKETDYLLGALGEIIKPSALRKEAECRHFGECGGCQWQHLDYEEQIRQKELLLKDALTRIGRLEPAAVNPCMPSSSQFHYRHRMQFNINHKGKKPHIGLYKRQTHDLIDIMECPIAHPAINRALQAVWNWLDKTNDKHLQGVDITCDVKGEKSILVLRYMKGSIQDKINDFELLKGICPEISGALVRIEEYKKASSALAGDPNLELVYDEIRYTVGPETFIQVNLIDNKTLINKVLEALPYMTEKILELHCGMGNFSVPMSKRTQLLFGVESNPEAYRFAQMNAHYNRRPNCSFIKKSDLKALKQMIRAGMGFSVLVLDPPRSGCKHILDLLPGLNIPKIIYVSCNPSTLARDLSILVNEQGYRLDSVQPIDMFPQTYHVECVSSLSK
ncbi:23S rRNA (uracil(1939)-C(5))-methyltransferase RlmD [bacterium]|nr:23S rRNA (uracil(1939)-C(5))-methyltransferase RlmD [bacterium]